MRNTLTTIELWGLVLANVLADLGPLGVPQSWKGPLAIASAIALALSRGLAKTEITTPPTIIPPSPLAPAPPAGAMMPDPPPPPAP